LWRVDDKGANGLGVGLKVVASLTTLRLGVIQINYEGAAASARAPRQRAADQA
jgi:hypothetical protein